VEWHAHAVGALIGERYRLIAPLARGGFGAVYEAEQITTERRVAIKLIARQPEDLSIDRMLGEARIASRLKSEHIVQVLDAGIDPASSTVFVAMELLSGVTLLDLVEQGGPRPGPEAAEYVRQIASGLDKAHRHVDRDGKPSPIVHRDLKPANVFVTTRDDGSALLKILDFGTAKMLSANAPSSRIVRGTPQYMAPEQLAGDLPTPATDVWALGLVAFFVLTGRSYWMAVAKQAAAEALFGEIYALPLVPASERVRALGVNVALGAAFDAWFARCVNRNADARFQHANEAARELAAALGGTAIAPPTLSAPPPGVTRTQTPSRSEEREVVPALGSPASDGISSNAEQPAPARSFRSRAFVALLAALVLAGAGLALLMERAADDSTAETTPTNTTTPAQAPSVEEAPPADPVAPAANPVPSSAVPKATESVADAPRAPPKVEKVRRPSNPPARETTPPAQPTSAPKAPAKTRPNVYEIR
jgi:serine/threonine protein kinase